MFIKCNIAVPSSAQVERFFLYALAERYSRQERNITYPSNFKTSHDHLINSSFSFSLLPPGQWKNEIPFSFTAWAPATTWTRTRIGIHCFQWLVVKCCYCSAIRRLTNTQKLYFPNFVNHEQFFFATIRCEIPYARQACEPTLKQKRAKKRTSEYSLILRS